ncbi:MAG: hypothetical protein EHM89_01765 [Acidobacteria bacterium]|nr:MAG: hypothetical protein EHM89_01765 [Acidobacteriota bacterium]
MSDLVFSSTTRHHVVVVPYKLDRDGLPIGLQLVGKRWDESRRAAAYRGVASHWFVARQERQLPYRKSSTSIRSSTAESSRA